MYNKSAAQGAGLPYSSGSNERYKGHIEDFSKKVSIVPRLIAILRKYNFYKRKEDMCKTHENED